MRSIDEIAEPFQMVDRDTRLDLLLEYASKLPPLPEEYAEMRDAGLNMVHECQSPVFLMPEVEGANGHQRVRVHADVPKQAPTARAFTAILHEAFDGARPDDVLNAPSDVLGRLGLDGMLGMQRTQGLSAIYARLRDAVKRKARSDEAAS